MRLLCEGHSHEGIRRHIHRASIDLAFDILTRISFRSRQLTDAAETLTRERGTKLPSSASVKRDGAYQRADRFAVKCRVEAGRDMNLHYDHPILLIQHMLWHEGYHHGQMKLALT
jgi:hypothetical protein